MDCEHPSSDHPFPPPISNLNWGQSVGSLNSILPLPISGSISMSANRLMPFTTDAGFAERAARYSCFGSANYGQFSDITAAGDLSPMRVEKEDGEFGSCREDSSVTDTISVPGEGNTKKRKAAPKRKVKETDFNAKNVGIEKDEHSVDEITGKEAPEPFKDYIHVRARRGQATDSHSLAERVRREKISQRMKLLQDLVPGCNKITGKALMLDEIINYVQALQRQVEFLSMKLASVNPGLDFNLENLISKESFLNQANASFSTSINPLENLAASINFVHQSKDTSTIPFSLPSGIDNYCSIDSIIHQAAMMQSSLDMFGTSVSQDESFWEDEFNVVLQSNFGHNQDTSQSFHGKMPVAHMKIEL